VDVPYPARLAAASELERLSEKARTLRLGQAGSVRLWAEANRAIAHVGHAVSSDRMAGRPTTPGDATVWTIAGGTDVLLVAWWVRLRPGSTFPAPTYPLIICMEPEDYVALDESTIGDDMVAEAHALAAEFLKAAGL
jgi:hypothetical protein